MTPTADLLPTGGADPSTHSGPESKATAALFSRYFGPGGSPGRPSAYHGPVDLVRLMDALVAGAGKLGVEVRVEPLTAGTTTAGGLCHLSGRAVVLLDERAALADRASVLAQILASLDHESIYLPPEAREYIRSEHARSAGVAPRRQGGGSSTE